MWTIVVAAFKSEMYRFLRLTAAPGRGGRVRSLLSCGYVHLPSGADAEWVKQLVGEQLVTVKRSAASSVSNGRSYASAMRPWIVACTRVLPPRSQADHRMGAMWRDLEQQIGMAPEVATEMVSEAIEAVAGVIRRTPARRDRRAVSFKLHELTSVAETYEMQRLAIRAKC
jgi:hypothetical protein